MNHIMLLAACLAAGISGANAASHEGTVRLQHTDYSQGYGSREMVEFGYVRRRDGHVLAVSAARGRREADARSRWGQRLDASLYRQWSTRLGTRTALTWGNDEKVFARRGIDQNVVLKMGRQYTATAGARLTRHTADVDASAFYLQGARYFNGAVFSLRHTRYHAAGRAGSHATLAALRLDDRAGSTSIWLGQGTAVHEYEWDEGVFRGRFHSIAVQRQQPLGTRWVARASVEKALNDTGLLRYQARGVSLGLSARW